MSEIPQWAKDKAREWLTYTFGPEGKKKHDPMVLSSLAALLVEVWEEGKKHESPL